MAEISHLFSSKLWVGKIWSAMHPIIIIFGGEACCNRGESGYQERKPPFQNRVRHCWNNSALSYFLLPASNMHSCQQLELTQAADLWINSAFAKHDLHEEGKENTNPLETAPLWEEMATMQKSIEMGSAAKTMLVFHVPKLSKVPLPPFNEPIASLSVRKKIELRKELESTNTCPEKPQWFHRPIGWNYHWIRVCKYGCG